MTIAEEILHRKALGILKECYGYPQFRPQQWDIIRHVVTGHDAIVLMPTGGGKSMCYQMPALLDENRFTIVVSPLLALMNDQVNALLQCNIPARCLNSERSDSENRETAELLSRGLVKLLYISPEKLLSELERWGERVTSHIGLFAIDEAHCISQWGHDFRPEYTQLGVLKQRFPDVPVMALTATADRITRDDIAQQLGIVGARLFISSFDRSNISLNVTQGVAGQKTRHIAQFIKQLHNGESGIVYCLSRKNTEKMADTLRHNGIKAWAYHAGMSARDKQQVQQAFINDDIQVVCATVAFGMGIDKSNVRFVIHSNMPSNIESYYQEIGRAGRDGLAADALLFYNYGDVVMLKKFALESGQSQVNMDKLRRMQQYAESNVCRRRILLSYFNERYDCDCGNCDICNNPPQRFDGTTLAQMALSAVKRTGEKVGVSATVDILRGWRKAEIVAAGYDLLKTFGIGRELSYAQWNAYMLQMLQMGLLEVAYNDGNRLKVTSYGEDVLYGRQRVEFTKFEPAAVGRNAATKRTRGSERKVFDDEVDERAPLDKVLFDKLRDLRKAIATTSKVPPYVVFNDKALTAITRAKPTTREAFSVVYGVGAVKCEKYWRAFTSVIRQHLQGQG